MERVECARCARSFDPSLTLTVCGCGGPLLARYRVDLASRTLRPEALKERRNDLWRYREVLPARGEPVSLGEGMTPLIDLPELAGELGLARLAVKDEAVNPTGSFKARGLSVAVTAALERGVRKGAIPSAGSAASAPSPAAEISRPSVPEPPWNASRANQGISATYEPIVRLAAVRSSSARPKVM